MSREDEAGFEKVALSADEQRKLEPIKDRVEKGEIGGAADESEKGKGKEPIGPEEERLLSLMREKENPDQDPEEILQSIAEFLKGHRADGSERDQEGSEAQQTKTETFAVRLREIEERERVRIYEDPQQDPAIQEIEREIGRLTAKYDEDRDRYHARTSDTNFDYRQDRQLAEFRTWESFTHRFPEKTQAYREQVPEIDQALQRIEERNQRSREKAQADQLVESEREERVRVYEDPAQDPTVEKTRKEIEAKIAGRGEVDDNVLAEIYKKVDTERAWSDFALTYPEKAAAYQDRIPEIATALNQLKVHEQEMARPPVTAGAEKGKAGSSQERTASSPDLNPLDPESRVEATYRTNEANQSEQGLDQESLKLLNDPNFRARLEELVSLYSTPKEFDARINKLKKEEPSLFLLLMKLVGDIAAAGEKLSREG